MKTTTALLIEWNPITGKRAGNIDPTDEHLHCAGWQIWECKTPLELRVITDDRDINLYKNIEGVTVIENIDNINECIKSTFKPRYENMRICNLNAKGDIVSLPEDEI